MLKATAQSRPRATGGKGPATREKIVSAALETLKQEGFAGASARTIAAHGRFNQALVFYHFGSVHKLLLAALDATSARRMERYESAVAEARSLPDMIQVAREIYREDLESGHITVLSEMIAGSITDPELGPQVTARMQPWIAFAEQAIEKAAAGTPFKGLLPARDLAFAVVAFYIGIDLLTALDGDRARAEGLFSLAESFLPMIQSSFEARA
jgi:AcrR family transcriptional regulator